MQATPPVTGAIPRPILLGIGALLAAVLIFVAAARLSGTPPSAAPTPSTPLQVHSFVLAELPQGGVEVRNPADGTVRARLMAGEDGFVRGLLRVLGRVRMQHDVPMDAPVTLIRWQNGRLTLSDPRADWSAELTGFGSSNTATFARLLTELEAQE